MHSSYRIIRLALPTSLLALALFFGPAPAVYAGSWDDGVAAIQAGDWARAESAFQAQTEATPDHAASWFMLAQAQNRQEKLDAAAAGFKRAVELAPDEVSYALAWGRNELERGQGDRAVVILTRQSADSVPEKHREAYGQVLAAAVLKAKHPESALEFLERAVEMDPGTPVLWTALGRARAAEERWEDAWQAYLEAANRSGAVDDRRRLVDFALRLDWYERAAEQAEPLVEASESGEDSLRLGKARLHGGDYEGALQALERAVELLPRNAHAAYYEASAHLLLKDGEEALSSLDAALDLDPQPKLRKKLLLGRGHALHQLERYEDAADAYRLAGDSERAAQMKKYALTAKDNEAWEQAKRDCLDRLKEARKLLADAAGLEDTPEYRRLQAEVDGLRQECSVYL